MREVNKVNDIIIEQAEIEKAMKAMKIKRIKKYIGKTIIPHAFLIFFSISFIVPFLWLVSTSLKPAPQIFLYPPKWIPEPVMWSNYVEALKAMPFWLYFRNTLILSIVPIIGQLFASPMVAYSLARIPWKGSKYLFGVLIACMLLPHQVTMIPVYITFSKLHWTGTFLPLTIPSFFGSAYFIFLLRQFFKTIPSQLSESARIDGAGEFRIYWQIMLPLAVPALITVGLFQFTWGWTDFLGPIMYLSKQSQWTLSLGLNSFKTEHSVQWELLFAASTVFILPMIILFFVGQKQFIKGIATTGFK